MSREHTMTLTLNEIENIFAFAMDKALDETDARQFWDEAKVRFPHAFRDF